MLSKKNLTINGIKVEYYDGGTGKNVFFLHGGRLRASTFSTILTRLSCNFRVIAPDIPGYGDSSTPTNLWSYQAYARFFHTFLLKLNLQNTTIIGYSLGGGIAYNLAPINPNTSQLILIDTSGIEKNLKSPLRRDLDRIVFYFFHPRYIATFLILLKESILFFYKHLLNIKHINNLRSALENSRRLNHKITVPTLILWGKNDTIFPISIAEKLHKTIKKSTVVIVNENHDWVLYKSNYCANLITEYLNKPTWN